MEESLQRDAAIPPVQRMKLFPVFPGFHSAQSKVPKDLRCRSNATTPSRATSLHRSGEVWFSTTRSTLMPVPRS